MYTKHKKTETLDLERVKIHLKGYRYQLFSCSINWSGDICIRLIIYERKDKTLCDKVILYIFGDGRRFNVFFERRKGAVLKFFGNVLSYFQANVLKRFFASFRSGKRLKKLRSYFLSSVIMMCNIKFREIIVERGW